MNTVSMPGTPIMDTLMTTRTLLDFNKSWIGSILNPDQTEDTDDDVTLHITDWGLFITNSIIIVLILLGNTLTLCLMARYKKLQTVTNSFVINLAFADLLMGCTYPFYTILNYTSFTEDKTELHTPCAISLYFIVVSAGVSNLGMLAVSIDRYIAVVHPLRYQFKVTRRRANISIVVIWIYIVTVSLSVFAVYGKDAQHYYNSSCSLLNLIPEWYFFGIILPHMLIPNVIGKVLYSRIIHAANKLEKKAHIQLISLGHSKAKKEYRAAKMMAIIMAMFILCWAPYTIFHIVIHAIGTDSPQWLYKALEVSKVFSASNSFINPLIYTWKNRKFRKALKSFLLCQSLQKEEVVFTINRQKRGSSFSEIGEIGPRRSRSESVLSDLSSCSAPNSDVVRRSASSPLP